MPELHHIGRIAYEAFCRSAATDGRAMPAWDQLREEEHRAWQAAGVAARDDGNVNVAPKGG